MSNYNSKTKGNNTVKKEEVPKFTIKVQEPADYPCLMKGGIITSYELMTKITELFSVAYKDFYGCYLSPAVSGHGFDVKLYFCTPSIDNGGESYAFEMLGRQNANDPNRKKGILEGLTSLEKRNSQRIYTLTDHGREGLIDFFPPNITAGVNVQRFTSKKTTDISKCVFEVTQNSNVNSGIYAMVTGLDINKLLAAIYGAKENGEYVQYQLTPIRPLGQVNQMSTTAAMDWILSIQRIGMNELNKVSRKVGMVQNNGIPMVSRPQK